MVKAVTSEELLLLLMVPEIFFCLSSLSLKPLSKKKKKSKSQNQNKKAEGVVQLVERLLSMDGSLSFYPPFYINLAWWHMLTILALGTGGGRIRGSR